MAPALNSLGKERLGALPPARTKGLVLAMLASPFGLQTARGSGPAHARP